jgi:hypothetical protein
VRGWLGRRGWRKWKGRETRICGVWGFGVAFWYLWE